MAAVCGWQKTTKVLPLIDYIDPVRGNIGALDEQPIPIFRDKRDVYATNVFLKCVFTIN
jgi:hypothetical protein